MVPPPDQMTEKLRPIIQAIASGSRPPDVEIRLRASGIPANTATVEHFTRICQELGGAPGNEEKLAVVLASLFHSAHPAGALVNFQRYIETVGVSETFLDTLAEAKPLRDVIAAVFGASQYMSDIIVRNPGYLYWLLEKGTWDEDDTVAALEMALENDTAKFATVEGKLNAARRFQRRMLLKIGVKDLLGVQGIEETAAKLSDLAEAIVRVVLAVLTSEPTPSDDASTRGGSPARDASLRASAERAASGAPAESSFVQSAPALDAGGFCVLALGKLGGRELNYSSDIDLIYVCRDADDRWFEHYHKLGTRLTKALSSVTEEGYLYRTDLRLRPDGDSGPLVNTLTAMRIYYESRGRPWEFQAMLKARVIAGDRDVGERFLTYVSGLLLNPSVAESPVEAIASMRTRIRENISDRDKSVNIKLMEGGIRDIEFIVQTLQLLHGKDIPSLRVPNTLEGLRRARENKLIKKTEMETMTQAYLFFRLVEHRLQMMHQIKTHSIPESPGEIELLARRVSEGPLGRYTYDAFLSTLAAHLNKIRLLGESFFAGHGMPEAAVLTLLPDEDEVATDVLNRYRFEDPKRALHVLHSLAYGSFPRLVDRTTRSALQKLLPLLLEDCAKTGDPDLALVNFANLAEAMKSEGGLYRILADVPPARLALRNLTGASYVLTAKLGAHPDVLDLLIEDPEWVVAMPAPEWPSLSRLAEKSSRVNTEDLQNTLREFFDRKILAAWIVDDRSGSFPHTMSQTLTAAVRESISNVLERLVGERHGVALLALGSFGVGEPRIESDADLLVVTRGRDIEEVTKSVHALQRVFSDGGLLKMDFRLRGEGANAPLVQDIDFYARYFRKRMAPWERVAFAKCAHWWGDEALSQDFLGDLLGVVATPLPRDRLEALKQMRRRLEGLVPAGSALFETKRSPGGRYDIEYLTSIGLTQTRSSHALHTNTLARLDALFSLGLISREERAALSAAFELYQRIDFLLELQGFSLPNTPEKEKRIAGYLDRTFALLGFPMEGGVENALKLRKREVRGCYERITGSV